MRHKLVSETNKKSREVQELSEIIQSQAEKGSVNLNLITRARQLTNLVNESSQKIISEINSLKRATKRRTKNHRKQ